MSGEGGVGMEGPRGDFVRQFGDPDRTWVNKTPKKALEKALEPQNKEAYIQRNLGSENIRKATEALERIKQNPANLTASEKQPSTADSNVAPEAQSNAPVSQVESGASSGQPLPKDGVEPEEVPAEGAPPTQPTGAEAPLRPDSEGQAKPTAATTAPEAEKKDAQESAPLTEAERAKRRKIVKIIAGYLNQELVDKAKSAEDPNEKAIFDVLRERWKADEGFGKIREDFERLKTNNPEQLMRELLRGRVKDGNRVFTDEQIDSLLADKSEGSFYKKMEPEVTIQVLRRKILESGLSPEDVSAIEKTQWGVDAVKQALAEDKEAQGLAERLIAEEGKSLVEKLFEKAKKRPLLLAVALGLAGIPGLIALLGYTALSKDE